MKSTEWTVKPGFHYYLSSQAMNSGAFFDTWVEGPSWRVSKNAPEFTGHQLGPWTWVVETGLKRTCCECWKPASLHYVDAAASPTSHPSSLGEPASVVCCWAPDHALVAVLAVFPATSTTHTNSSDKQHQSCSNYSVPGWLLKNK